MNDELPPRPTDPIGSLIYDSAYGAASKANPFIKIITQLEKLNEGAKSFAGIVGNMAEMSKALKETTAELKETNRLLREMTKISK